MKKILIFEDDQLLRSMYETKFGMEGFGVAGYDNPSNDPVSIVLKEKPDAISMDVMMPVMNGFEATGLIKGDSRTKNIPVIFLTNLGQQQDIDKGKALGAAEYIIKANHMPSEVVDRFRKILGLPIPQQQKDIPRQAIDALLQTSTPTDTFKASKIRRSISVPIVWFGVLATLAALGIVELIQLFIS